MGWLGFVSLCWALGFEDITARSGITFKHESSISAEKYLPESMGAGVALIDYDRDGLLDIYFVNGATLPGLSKADSRFWNRLYRNLGGGKFEDVTVKAGVQGVGYGMGAAVGDFDNDGYSDLFIANLNRNTLYRNTGKGTFEDVTDRAGLGGGGWSVGAAFVDYDRDGKLDLFVSRYVQFRFDRNPWCGDRKPGYRSYCHPDQFGATTHLLYRNQSDGKFRDVSQEMGIAAAPGKGLGVAVNDVDNDGWPDIAVANDSAPQQLFRNNGGKRFEEVALSKGLAYDEDGRVFAGMGIDFADYDHDGRPDIFINALAQQRYALFRNKPDYFDYHSGPAGVGAITNLHSGWGARFIDYDNDGWRDLFVAQGHVMDNIELTQPQLRYLEPLLLMRNVGGKFEDVSKRSGAVFEKPLAARGAAFGDLDNDGFADVVISCNNGAPVILRNTGKGGHWLQLKLTGRRSNRDAIGAKVHVTAAGGLTEHAFVSGAGSYLSASDARLHFGLGTATAADVEVTWPTGATEKRRIDAVDRLITWTEGDS